MDGRVRRDWIAESASFGRKKFKNSISPNAEKGYYWRSVGEGWPGFAGAL
jgi:hypothetical protein